MLRSKVVSRYNSENKELIMYPNLTFGHQPEGRGQEVPIPESPESIDDVQSTE